MEGLTTLIFLAGLLIAWGVQQRKREKEAEEKKQKRLEALLNKKRLKEQQNRSEPKRDQDQDLKNRHLKGTLNYSDQIQYNKQISPTSKINRLSSIKKAIIWSDIINKPVSER